jgi:hypothetical protein
MFPSERRAKLTCLEELRLQTTCLLEEQELLWMKLGLAEEEDNEAKKFQLPTPEENEGGDGTDEANNEDNSD